MKKLTLLLFLCWHTVFYAQDTTLLMQFPDGGTMIEIRTKTDTTKVSYYTGKQIESVIKRDPTTQKTHYIRYYRNGKKMWDKEWKNDIENGNCSFFNTKGTKVAEFKFSGGKIIDTLFLAKNTYLLFGSLNYSSTVYGGMQNEDGSSNISSISGPYMHSYMKFLPTENVEANKPVSEYYFTSDFRGKFIVILKPGAYGLFEKNFDPKRITNGHYIPDPKRGNSWESHWDSNNPVIISKDKAIYYRDYHHTSVGYAP